MTADSSNPRQTVAGNAAAASEAERFAMTAAERYAGAGWQEFDAMASDLRWPHARLTSVLRWLKHQAPAYIIESRISRGVVNVRITKVTVEDKQAKQLSTDIVALLVKLYANLKHSDRNRDKLADDVKTIATRIAPFLEDSEFQIQYKKLKRRLSKPQQETNMETGAESAAAITNSVQSQIGPYDSVPRTDGPRASGFDRRVLPRLILGSSIIICGLIITIFLATTLLHAMELLSQYVERINTQGGA